MAASAREILVWLRSSWGRIALILLLVAGLAFLAERIDVDTVQDYAEHMNGVLVFVLVTLLPLFGFPVTVTHVVAGLRWGPALGISLVAVSILLQLLLSYGIFHAFGYLFAHRLEPIRRRIPHAADGPVTLFTVLLQGVPYFLKNYVLPLIGVPLRIFVLWSLPVHVVRSVVAVLLGGHSDDLTPSRIAFFAIYYVIVLAACAWAFRRIRAQVEDRPPEADGRTQTA